MGYVKIGTSNTENGYAAGDVNEYLIDAAEDVVDIEDAAPGSVAYTADMKYMAMKDRNGNWVQIV